MALVTTGIGVASGSGTTATGALPTGITTNVQLVAFVRAASISAEPSGWTQVATVGSGPVLRIYRRKASGSDTAPQWTVGSGDWIVIIGRDPDADPDAAIRSPYGTRDSTWADSASVTLTSGQAGDIVYYLAGTASGAYTSTPPSGMTERVDQVQGSSGLTVADMTLASTGSITKANTFSGWQNVQGLMIAVPALSGGGGSPPTAPSGLTASPQSATQINLSWTDNSSDETGFTVERSAAGAGSWSVLSSSVAANATSYNDTTASANTTYDYRVKAQNGAGSSSYATASGARTYPGAPTSPGASATSSSAITISWTAPSGGATSYKVERSLTGTGSWTEIATGVTGTSHGDTGLTSSTTYYYRVRATNAQGDGAYSSNASATTNSGASVPDQVTGLSATPASSTQINLSWSTAGGATSYKVERSLDGSTGWTQLVSGHGSTSYSSTGLSAGTTYYYRVRATNAQGDGAYSSTVSATTSGSAPAAPTSPAATPQSSSAIRVTWTASSGATGYTVERAPSASGPWSAVVTGHTASPFDDTGLSPSTVYHYRIIATNAAGASSPSASVSATTSAAGSTITYPAGTTWQWTEADWQYVERIGTVNVTATAGVGYVALSKDGLTYDFFSGPLTGGRLTYIASGALGSAAETSARGAAVALPTVAGGLWEIPPVYQARYTRLGHRNTGASYGLREFFPRRLVEADDMRAETITGRLIKAATIVGDHLFGTTLAALKAELGIVTLGTNGGLWQGAGTFAAPTTGLKIWNDSGRGRLATYNGGVVQVEIDTTGALAAGGGAVKLDQQGLQIRTAEGSGASVLAFRRANGEITAEQYSVVGGDTVTVGTHAVPTATLPRAVWTAFAGSARITLDNGGNPSTSPVEARLDAGGSFRIRATEATLSVPLTVSGAIAATAGISSGGATAGFNFIDRVNSANTWVWYASGTARLFRSGIGDVFTVEAAGNGAFAGSLTTGGIVGIRNTPFGNTALFIRSLGTTNSTYGLSITDSGGSSNTFYVADNGETYIRGNTGIRTVPETSVALSVNGATTGTTQFAFSARSSLGTSDTLFYVRNDGYTWNKGTIDVGGLNNRSDQRLKTNIAPIASAIVTLRAFPARQWVWTDDPTGRTHYGPIAQDVELVAPELVSEGLPGPGQRLLPGHRGILSLDLPSFVGLLHGGFHELYDLFLQLTARIDALEAQL